MVVFHTRLANLKIKPSNHRHNWCFAVANAFGFTHYILDLVTPIMKSGLAHSIYVLVLCQISQNTISVVSYMYMYLYVF